MALRTRFGLKGKWGRVWLIVGWDGEIKESLTQTFEILSMEGREEDYKEHRRR